MTQGHFDERAPHEAGFGAVFAAQILPLYRACHDEGLRAATRARQRALAIFALGLVSAAGLLIWDPFGPSAPGWALPVFALFVGTVLALILRDAGKARFNARLKAQVAPILARFMGVAEYQIAPGRGFVDLKAVQRLKLVASHTGVRVEDGLSGEWRGVGYRLAEVDLTRRRAGEEDRRDRIETVFRGLAMEIAVPHDMPLVLFLPRVGGILHQLRESFVLDRGLVEVPLGGDVALPVTMYSDDPKAARAEIGPGFGGALLAIAGQQGSSARGLAAAFEGRVFHLMLSAQERFFEIDAFGKDEAAFTDSCRAALADMARPRQVIDLLIDGAEDRA